MLSLQSTQRSHCPYRRRWDPPHSRKSVVSKLLQGYRWFPIQFGHFRQGIGSWIPIHPASSLCKPSCVHHRRWCCRTICGNHPGLSRHQVRDSRGIWSAWWSTVYTSIQQAGWLISVFRRLFITRSYLWHVMLNRMLVHQEKAQTLIWLNQT